MTYFNNGEVPDSLKHYGVKGMKWGVRKQRANRRVNKYKGSRRVKKAKAIGVQAAKHAGISTVHSLLSWAGGQAINALPVSAGAKQTIQTGRVLVDGILSLGYTIDTGRNMVDIARTDLQRGPRLDYRTGQRIQPKRD